MVVNCWFLYMGAMYSWFISLATALCYGSISKLREDNGLFLLMSTAAHPSNPHRNSFFPFHIILLFHITDMLFKTSFQFFHIILYNATSLCSYKRAFQLLPYSVATFVQVLFVTFFWWKHFVLCLKFLLLSGYFLYLLYVINWKCLFVYTSLLHFFESCTSILITSLWNFMAPCIHYYYYFS
jgi:hypothetical protein